MEVVKGRLLFSAVVTLKSKGPLFIAVQRQVYALLWEFGTHQWIQFKFIGVEVWCSTQYAGEKR